ncbi:unnamed protein product [Urochloa decumbens]|uniref:Uncharacterized protein n=1 Tax=Urochloa decumbens TaxID=240449 RepID=A0ABC8WUZ0_9POAL
MRKRYPSPSRSVFTLCLVLLVIAAIVSVMCTSSVEAAVSSFSTTTGRSGYNSYHPDGRGGYNSVPTNGGGSP